MPEIGGEGIEEVADRFAQLSERQAANARTLLEEIERRRREAREQGRNFSAPTGAQVLDRLQSARSPMFFFLAWNSATSSPGTINLTTGVFNPDPVTQVFLFVHVFIGPATLAADVGQALELVDERFPRLTEPPFFGLTLDPSASTSLDFSIAIPANIEPSNYLGNAFLFQASYFTSASPTFDRALFVFQVT
jgi:hypothetical protein